MSLNVIHIGDIFYPPNDPDDVLDVEALVGLHCAGKINLLLIILDRSDIQVLKPGKQVIERINAAAGTSIPFGIGYTALLNTLRNAPGQVVITSSGSLEVLYWAYKTDPDLCKQKIKENWIFAGDAQLNPIRGHRDGRNIFHLGLEYNVAMDHIAFREVMRSELNIVWVPCYDGGLVREYFDGVNMLHGSYWLSQYDQLFSKSLPQTRDTYIWALSGERGDGQIYAWESVRYHHKELFGVGIFRAIAEPGLSYPFRFIDERITVNENATVARGSGKQVKLFERTDKANYYQRMTEISTDVLGMMGRATAPPAESPTLPQEGDNMFKIIDPNLKFSTALKPITEKIEKIIQHHMAHTTWTVQQVHIHHRDSNGWAGIGYNYWIAFDGTVYEGRGRHVGAHAGASWNGRSLGIGYQGNFELQQMTDAQLKSGAWLNAKLMKQEGLQVEDIIGHDDVTATLCPGKLFKMAELKQEIENIIHTGGDSMGTPILGKPQLTAEQAKTWARNRNATERFVNIAEFYWQLAPERNIRPEVLYAQSSRETGNGHFGRLVTPEMNNWAGIKKEGYRGETREDHESFASDFDGVRAHVNHICAYVGQDTIGEPHGRYYTVMGLDWAGTVKYVEQLGGKYAPSITYGTELVELYLNQLLETPADKNLEQPDCRSCKALEEELNQRNIDYLTVSDNLSQVKKRKDLIETEIKKAASILNNLL